jgi:hypothetical protein
LKDLYGEHDMKKTIMAAAIVLAAAGCGSSGHGAAAARTKPSAAPSKTACDPAGSSCIPPHHPSTSAIAVPVLEVGKSMPIQLPTSNGTAKLEMTATALKLRHPKGMDNPKDDQLCFAFKLKNTGSVAYKANDMTAAISWVWFGLDGQQNDNLDATVAGACKDLGKENFGFDQAAPLPGKYATGVYAIAVPKARRAGDHRLRRLAALPAELRPAERPGADRRSGAVMQVRRGAGARCTEGEFDEDAHDAMRPLGHRGNGRRRNQAGRHALLIVESNWV